MDLVWQAVWAIAFTYYWIRDIQEGPKRYGGGEYGEL